MVQVVVVGCGRIGIKIAGNLAYHGHSVRVYDQKKSALDTVYERLQYDKRNLKRDGILIHPDFIGEIYCFSQLEEAVQDVAFIFEAIDENLAAKQDLLERISHCCKATTVIGSSTLNLKLDDIVERTAYKERALGVRFLYPVYCIPEVELTIGKFTSIKSLEKVLQFLEAMGSTAFFRSGVEPLILTDKQREIHWRERAEQVQRHRGLGGRRRYLLPELAHSGNFAPKQDDSTVQKAVVEKECVICMDAIRNCLLHPCHHLCTCNECGWMLVRRHDNCPICRKEITEIIRFYQS